jgi:hypothetical protein
VEADHFGETCFRVGRKIFASCGEKSGVCRLVFQLEPEHASRLVEEDPRFEAYSRQKDCVSMDAAGVTDWDEVRVLALESYRLNALTERARKVGTGRARKRRPRTK